MKYSIILLLLLSSCKDDGIIRINAVSYFLDKRTNLCFAQSGTYMSNSYAMTNVPCNELVLKAIEDDS